MNSLMYLYVFLNESTVDPLLVLLEKTPLRYARYLHAAASAASYYLGYNIGQINSSDASSVRARARDIELRVLRAVDQGLQDTEGHVSQTSGRATTGAKRVNELLRAVDTLVLRLYVLINANPQLNRQEDKQLSYQETREFFNESVELWDSLAGVNADYARPMLPSTTHRLMESFNHLLKIDPERVLRMVRNLITGRTLGYEFDQLAIGEFVKFAEQMMADHRDILREATSASHFADVLDVFVRAGWPSATQIVLRMDAAVR